MERIERRVKYRQQRVTALVDLRQPLQKKCNNILHALISYIMSMKHRLRSVIYVND